MIAGSPVGQRWPGAAVSSPLQLWPHFCASICRPRRSLGPVTFLSLISTTLYQLFLFEMSSQLFIDKILSHLPALIRRYCCLEHCVEKAGEAGARCGRSISQGWAACVLCVCQVRTRTFRPVGCLARGCWPGDS